VLVFPESQPQYLLHSGIAYATRQFSKKNRPEDSRRIYISDVESADSMIKSHIMSLSLLSCHHHHVKKLSEAFPGKTALKRS